MKHFDRFAAKVRGYDAAYLRNLGIEWLPSAMRDAAVIDASNVGRYLSLHEEVDITSMPGYVPPFEVTWWESSFVPFKSGIEFQRELLKKGRSREEVFKHGVLRPIDAIAAMSMTQDFGTDEDAGEEAWDAFVRRGVVDEPHREFDSNTAPRWIVSWEVFLSFGGTFPMIPKHVRYLVGRDGRIVLGDDGTPWVGYDRSRELDLSDRMTEDQMRRGATGIARSMLRDITTFVMAVGFTHCKNVELVEGQQAEGKLRKKQEKKLGRPLTRFHELVIDPSMTQKRYTERNGGPRQRGTRSLHIARGHFRTYTEDKPLFGKYSGTFWVPAHVRGSADVGMVAKDYAVRGPRAR